MQKKRAIGQSLAISALISLSFGLSSCLKPTGSSADQRGQDGQGFPAQDQAGLSKVAQNDGKGGPGQNQPPNPGPTSPPSSSSSPNACTINCPPAGLSIMDITDHQIAPGMPGELGLIVTSDKKICDPRMNCWGPVNYEGFGQGRWLTGIQTVKAKGNLLHFTFFADASARAIGAGNYACAWVMAKVMNTKTNTLTLDSPIGYSCGTQASLTKPIMMNAEKDTDYQVKFLLFGVTDTAKFEPGATYFAASAGGYFNVVHYQRNL